MRMTDTYQDAIKGTLCSYDGGEWAHLEVVNDTAVGLTVFLVTFDGDHAGYNWSMSTWQTGYPGIGLAPGGVLTAECSSGTYWLVKTKHSGSFAAVIEAHAGDQVVALSGLSLLDPNNIGDVPEPNSRMIIPPDGPTILVGVGSLPNGNAVTREQFWQRLPDSYSLAPGEHREVNFTITTGMQQSSSSTKTATDSVSTSVSAGWGPFSASVSASLSKSSTATQQVTVSTQQTSFVSTTYDNDGPCPVMLLNWQLADVITVTDRYGTCLSSVISGTTPTVVYGPVDVDQLKPSPQFRPARERTEESRQRLPRLLELQPAADSGP